jgi:hypothetical protein
LGNYKPLLDFARSWLFLIAKFIKSEKTAWLLAKTAWKKQLVKIKYENCEIIMLTFNPFMH